MKGILYEDNHLLAVSKAPGELTQKDKSGDPCVLDRAKSYLRERYSKSGNVFLGLPHRLDRPTSGVLVLARTSKALTRLSAAFRERNTKKIYWAVVNSIPENPEGELIHWIRKDGRTNIARRAAPGIRGVQEARLRYKHIASLERCHLLEIELLTGRHHQIRYQLAAAGCPVRGDLKYGAKRPAPFGGIYLHARRLEVPHPTRDEIVRITAPVFDDKVWKLFEQQLDLGE